VKFIMRILLSVKNFYPPRGGAALTIYTLIRYLSKKHEVIVVQRGKSNSTLRVNGIRIFFRRLFTTGDFRYASVFFENKRWLRILKKIVSRIDPDVILTQLDLVPSTIEVARLYKIPSIIFIHDYRHICPFQFFDLDPFSCDKKCWLCKLKTKSKAIYTLKYIRHLLEYRFVEYMQKWNKKSIENADVVIANSRFMSNVLTHWFDANVKVVYPFIDYFSVRSRLSRKEQQYITFINPIPLKGVEIFIRICQRMRNRWFICLGKTPRLFEYKRIFAKLNNICHLNWVKDIRVIYSKTRILLVPSVWPEPFGRVCVEAMINSIPPLVSNRGALPEIVKNYGIIIENLFDINEWIEKIQMLDDESVYKKFKKKAERRANFFKPEKAYKKFEKIVKKFV